MTTPAQPPSTQPAPEAQLSLAHDRFRAGRFQHALALIDQLPSRQPRNPLIWNVAAAIAWPAMSAPAVAHGVAFS